VPSPRANYVSVTKIHVVLNAFHVRLTKIIQRIFAKTLPSLCDQNFFTMLPSKIQISEQKLNFFSLWHIPTVLFLSPYLLHLPKALPLTFARRSSESALAGAIHSSRFSDLPVRVLCCTFSHYYSLLFVFQYSVGVCFLVLFLILCILCFCIVSTFVYSCLFPISVQVYWPLPPGWNPFAVNKYSLSFYKCSASH
jgi:hypothetical protein